MQTASTKTLSKKGGEFFFSRYDFRLTLLSAFMHQSAWRTCNSCKTRFYANYSSCFTLQITIVLCRIVRNITFYVSKKKCNGNTADSWFHLKATACWAAGVCAIMSSTILHVITVLQLHSKKSQVWGKKKSLPRPAERLSFFMKLELHSYLWCTSRELARISQRCHPLTSSGAQARLMKPTSRPCVMEPLRFLATGWNDYQLYHDSN